MKWTRSELEMDKPVEIIFPEGQLVFEDVECPTCNCVHTQVACVNPGQVLFETHNYNFAPWPAWYCVESKTFHYDKDMIKEIDRQEMIRIKLYKGLYAGEYIRKMLDDNGIMYELASAYCRTSLGNFRGIIKDELSGSRRLNESIMAMVNSKDILEELRRQSTIIKEATASHKDTAGKRRKEREMSFSGVGKYKGDNLLSASITVNGRNIELHNKFKKEIEAVKALTVMAEKGIWLCDPDIKREAEVIGFVGKDAWVRFIYELNIALAINPNTKSKNENYHVVPSDILDSSRMNNMD